ncbi:MAG: hypothetical protein KC544_01695 [Gemmatimonadetes bacterium]|nr:hypothetical protein [Gemmatimonadota bacterium]MCB9505580.1 hypothetical protein [Gemmatimonadales bacterium]MCA9769025.1 hypothetical protein [Gemmatimonadota bacterium]MCB9518599.1 hypothetical protein [Gemmatimonadales bacterium]HPF62226.1 hypothetical protein [Gemmatimonadales bacterium]
MMVAALRLAVVVASVAACGASRAPAQQPASASPTDSLFGLVPPGYGQLNQDVITIRLRSGDLEIRFTPLDERVTRLLADDAYQSLNLLTNRYQATIDSLAAVEGIRRPGLALITFFALAPNTPFDPNLVLLTTRNRLLRPSAFIPLSASFSAQRLEVRTQAMGLYLFEDIIPVTEPFSIGYLGSTTDEWERRLTRFDRERARILGKVKQAPTSGTP